jgi:hypothetical protein
VMSALPGKVMIDGVVDVGSRQLFVLSFLQARNPAWCKRPFLAEFDPSASWMNELRPAFGQAQFFYEAGLEDLLSRGRAKRFAELPTLTEPFRGNQIPA